jgi:UDP-2,3-diacylglucosamine pyrophosphatase LpxH
LEENTAQTLILNGDIIDMWALKRGSKWRDIHTKALRKILKISEKCTQVYWLKGNHDDFIHEFIPFELGNIKMQENLIYVDSNGKSSYVFHGDVLDVFISDMKWLAKIGSVGYDIALWLNSIYNKYREWRGLPYYSISKDIKNGVKKAINFITDFEKNAIKLAKHKGCDYAICGHIHQPRIKEGYMNSGDFVENCTALVETWKGEWKILEFHN